MPICCCCCLAAEMAISGSRVKAQPRLSLSSALCLQLLRERESGRERVREVERQRERGVAAELIIRGCKMKTKRNAQIFVVVVVVFMLGKCGRCRCHVEKLQSLPPISTCGTPLCVCVCVSCTCHCLCLSRQSLPQPVPRLCNLSQRVFWPACLCYVALALS